MVDGCWGEGEEDTRHKTASLQDRRQKTEDGRRRLWVDGVQASACRGWTSPPFNTSSSFVPLRYLLFKNSLFHSRDSRDSRFFLFLPPSTYNHQPTTINLSPSVLRLPSSVLRLYLFHSRDSRDSRFFLFLLPPSTINHQLSTSLPPPSSHLPQARIIYASA